MVLAKRRYPNRSREMIGYSLAADLAQSLGDAGGHLDRRVRLETGNPLANDEEGIEHRHRFGEVRVLRKQAP